MKNIQLFPLGGVGNVTQNMFLYMLEDEMLVVDCGIGFPDHNMPGVDVLIPDISYLLEQIESGKQLVGMVFTHGHEDHIGALPYLADHLPQVPVYGSELTAGFANKRLREAGKDWKVETLDKGARQKIGGQFEIELVSVTHSVPDTCHVVVRTQAGTIYHGSDFKFDDKPVDGKVSNYQRMEEIGKEGVLCALVDCLRVESEEPIPSESTIGPVFEEYISGAKGKVVITLMSSHIHRIQQVVDAAVATNRKVAFIGRSIEQNVAVALDLNLLNIPNGVQVDKRDAQSIDDQNLILMVAGSQGQEGSSMTRAVYGEHRDIMINSRDLVIFSANVIPGNEINYYGLIDTLTKNGIEVVYPDIDSRVHHSGHASVPEQRKLVKLIKPQYLFPAGGADRHRALFFSKVAQPEGYARENILIPDDGQVLSISQAAVEVVETVNLIPQLVDGLGIGDVGPKVLGDRKRLSESGMVVVVIPTKSNGSYDLNGIQVVSQGFVFMKQAGEVVDYIHKSVIAVIKKNSAKNQGALKSQIEKVLRRKLFKAIRREPMVTVVFA